MSFLTMKCDMIAHGINIFLRKLLVWYFSFLQAYEIRIVFIDDGFDLMQSNPNTVDIE